MTIAMRAFLPAALVALLVVASGGHAQAEPDPSKGPALNEAREHARQGAALYHKSDFAAALVEFKRAYALSPNYRVLYNVGQTLAELQDYVAAQVAFERYLSEGGAKIPRERRAAVEAEVAKLAARVATVQVQVNVDGAEILVDGVLVGRSPLAEPLRLNAGVRTIAASKPPLASATRAVELAGRDQATIVLELTLPARPSLALSPSSQLSASTAHPEAAPKAPWVGIALTGAFAAGAVVTGLFTLDARRDFRRELGRLPSSDGDLDRTRTRMHGLAISTDVLAVAALATAAISAYPFVFRRASADTTAWSVQLGPTGAAFGARF
jgi:tetratricopeptide (TPR) repeat protein